MALYISAKCKGTHIANLARTTRFLSEACDLVFDAASQGKSFLIVGTKKRATNLVASAVIRSCYHYANKKWFSGMLTNWSITKTRLSQFRDLRAEEKMGKFHHLPKRDSAILKKII